VFGDSVSGNDNALVYIPTGLTDPNIAPIGAGANNSTQSAVESLIDFANGLGCAKKYAGRTVPRNSCTNDWYYDMDLSFSQEIPGPGRFFGRDDKIRLYATMDNFLNFLNGGANVQRRRSTHGLQDIATTTGVDSAGRYIIKGYTGNTFAADNQINFSSSVWRLKVGVSYEF
jgi:hypothetical protein